MALLFTTYDELQTSIIEFVNREDDSGFADAVPGFIALAEARMKRMLRRTTVVDTLSVGSGDATVEFPEDLEELRSIAQSATLGYPPVKIVSFEQLNEMKARFSPTGRPQFATVAQGILYLVPAPTDAYLDFTISYFSTLVPLSDENESNEVLIQAPDAYLYGALCEAAPYLQHDERLPIWEAKFAAAIESLNTDRQNKEFGASVRPARLPVVFG
jgi:hypothetical protein